MARKGVLTVIIEYPLSPEAQYQQMATASAKAVQWVKENIKGFGGDPDRIFVSGHSAGGHLAALISIRPEYFDSLSLPNPIKGLILIDAAGLDMYRLSEGRKVRGNASFFSHILYTGRYLETSVSFVFSASRDASHAYSDGGEDLSIY
jgi:pimeloyl-ACP methyl ester carboxylesterase